jgi:hypothetical protein
LKRQDSLNSLDLGMIFPRLNYLKRQDSLKRLGLDMIFQRLNYSKGQNLMKDGTLKCWGLLHQEGGKSNPLILQNYYLNVMTCCNLIKINNSIANIVSNN